MGKRACTTAASLLIALLTQAAVAAPTPYRLAISADGLNLLAVTPKAEAPMVSGLSFRACNPDGTVAFETRGFSAAPGQPEVLQATLTGPAAQDAVVTVQVEQRARHALLTWRIRYHGPKREFHQWSTGFLTPFSREPEGVFTESPILWRLPSGAREWEVPGDAPYPDFEWQLRRVRFGPGGPELVIATDWYDPDWIYGGNAARAPFHRAVLPAEPGETVRRMALFVLQEAGEPSEVLAAEASGRPAVLLVDTPHGFLFEPDTPVRFTLRARQLADTPVCRLTWDVWDYYGERVAHGEAARLGSPWQAEPVSLDYKKRGILFLDARLEPVAPEGTPRPAPVYTRRATFGILPRRVNTPPQPESPFGLAGLIANPEAYPDQHPLEAVLPLAQRIGVRWLRTGFPVKLEMTPEEERAVRQRVALLRQHGISVHAQLGVGIPKPEETADLLAALRASLLRFRDLSRHIELGNELNFSHPAKEYVERLLRPTTEVIRQVHPQARVFTMGLGGVDLNWLRDLEAAGGLELVDVLSIHPGCHPKAPEMFNGWRGWFFPPQVVDAIAAARRHQNRDVWITEAYAPTHPVRLGLDVRTSADYLVRTYVVSLALGVKVVEWYQLQDGTWYAQRPDPTDVEHSFGIAYTDLSPKPAYVAYGVMTEMLEGLRPLGRLDLGTSDLYGVRFARGDRVVDVLWSYREKHETDVSGWPPERYAHLRRIPREPWQSRWVEPVQVKLPARGPVKVTDILGNVTQAKPVGGTVALALSGSPLYVEGLGRIRLQKPFWDPKLFQP